MLCRFIRQGIFFVGKDNFSMSLKSFVKRVAPQPLWNYLKRKKSIYVMSQCMKLQGFPNTCIWGDWEDITKFSGKNKIIDGEQYYSQACQDFFLDRFIFGKKRDGFFIDIGGNDPIAINNTYFFEKNRGWSGLAFEPIEHQREKWKPARKTECLPYALGSSNGETEFCEYEAHVMSGLSSAVDFDGKIVRRYKIPVRKLSDILEERGIKHVDFVSLDVEGAEIDVLSGIDFDKVNISCFTIETNKGYIKDKRIRDFMFSHGYKIRARLWLDDVYIKKNLS